MPAVSTGCRQFDRHVVGTVVDVEGDTVHVLVDQFAADPTDDSGIDPATVVIEGADLGILTPTAAAQLAKLLQQAADLAASSRA